MEGLIAQHLRAWIDYSHFQGSLYYWRTKSGSEVDFILYGEEGFWAIEVKNTTTIRSADIRALKAFITDYPESTPLFLYRGREKLKIDRIRCMPCHDFIINLIPGKDIVSR